VKPARGPPTILSLRAPLLGIGLEHRMCAVFRTIVGNMQRPIPVDLLFE